ncbi:hypothetical protein SLEP1_g14535 [Rubroshorea leprosula]|uniref:Transposase (putative) gypsy type domain-containing protein n=1 Tax=Rubroshorea leprosula TaxID=152421 RepID=A0AAV5IQE5_9ROSI|nr:hypothetical protein SLEP1_g14535 [Rubroshorea leprosula]
MIFLFRQLCSPTLLKSSAASTPENPEPPIDPLGIGHVGMLVFMLPQLGLTGGNLGPLCIAPHEPTLLGRSPVLFGCWAGPIPNGFDSLQPTSTRAELKSRTRRGELASLKTCGRAGIHSHISVAPHLGFEEQSIRSPLCTASTIVQKVKMDFSRELRELRGNQSREEEEVVIAAEPIAMIVPPELQDLPEILTSESSASSNAGDNGDGHRDSPSSSSSPGNHEPESENVGGIEQGLPVAGEWEDRVLPGRLSNIRKAPKDLPAGFKFRAALHHEVADCAPSISGYRRLEEMIQEYHIPRTILVQTGGQNERACSVSRTGWIPVYADHFDAGLRFPLPGLVFDLLADYELALTQLTPNSIRFIVGFMLLCARLEVPAKAIVFRSLFQCRLCPNSGGARWYYLSRRDKSQLFKNVRNKVARWKRQFIFVRDTRTERVSNDLAARLSDWRTPNAHVNYPQLLPRDTDLKNRLLEHARRENLVDLEALVTPELLAVFGI